MATDASSKQGKAPGASEDFELPEVKAVSNRAMERRLLVREMVWGPGVEERIWNKKEKGFCTIPRTLPLVSTLIRQLTKNVDAGRVFIDLWSRQFEDGFIEIHDEQELAASCGYPNGSRGVRSWREAMTSLESLGFIQSKPKGSRKFGYVLLPHPHDVVVALLSSDEVKVPEWWASLFQRRILEVGTRLRGS